MKKLASILAFLLSFPCEGAITFNAANNTGVAVLGSQSVTINAVAGNFVVLDIELSANGTACATRFGTISVADTAANTWAQTGTGFTSSGNFDCLQQWYAYLGNGNASDVITVSWSLVTTQPGSVVVLQFSGGATTTASLLDVTNKGTGTASPFTSGTFTTTNTDDVVVCNAGNYYQNGFTASTIGATTATIPANGKNGTNGATGGNSAGEYVIETTIQTGITGKMAVAGASVAGGIICGAFFPAAGATSPATNNRGLTINGGRLTINSGRVTIL